MAKSKDHPKKHPTANKVECWNPHDDINKATDRLEEMFVEMGQKTRIERGAKPARRAVFRKQHGIAYGQFIINPDLEDRFKIGIFSGQKYDCAVRFSSDTTPTSPDLGSTLGVGLKLFGVEGPKLIGEGVTSDFIFQNIDRFFARDAQQMTTFTTAGVIDGNYGAYLKKHREVAEIIQDMQKEEGSCLSASYWAILPFKLGEEQIVKYRLIPEGADQGVPFNQRDYLKLDLEQRLRRKAATFRFEIQLRTSEEMPIDDAQQVWSEKESPFIPIARLELPQQDITDIGQSAFGKNLSFNIWRTLAEHEPLGSIAQVRKRVYEASAQARHQANGQLPQEPTHINPPFRGNIDENSDCIVTAGIYPPIGVTRVGNSEEYFLGPEIDNPLPNEDPLAYRDKKGALKRQAAKFRIYGFNAAGKAVKELTLDEDTEITWHCHLANQKSSWYQFHVALDIPEAANEPPARLRNIDVKNRDSLIIDGKKQSLSGKAVTRGPVFRGKFLKERRVYLGEMRTDEEGRLIMLGGFGRSENIDEDIAITFANNEGWYDDISDGPVTAHVKYKGVSLQVDPAWVICAPPNYAPEQKSVRTMWDLMRDVAVKANMLTRPARPSFTHDILPIFERMHNLQWVNAGFAGAFGHNGQFNYTTPEWIAKLGNPSPAFMEMRRTLSNNFRRYKVSGATAPQLWPWVYGDAIAIPSEGSPRQHATLSDLQLEFLDQWVKGDFDADYSEAGIPRPIGIEDLPVAEQPDMLTKASMEFCLADAFHPGCEMTWPMRSSGMYMSPFRVKHAPKNPKTNRVYYGPVMDNSVITLAEGPLLGGQVAGGITRWMAIPWQTDTASCRDGYISQYDPYLPTFWPARVPNNIMTEKRYEQTRDGSLDEETRLQAFAARPEWLDDLPLNGAPATYTNQINSMIDHFDQLAVVQRRPGVQGNPLFPTEMEVGITPDSKQDKALQNAVKEEIKEKASEHEKTLESAMSQLEVGETEEALKSAKMTLQTILSPPAEEDEDRLTTKKAKEEEKDLPLLKQYMRRLAHKEHKLSQATATPQEVTEPQVGVPDQLGRFRRYTPE